MRRHAIVTLALLAALALPTAVAARTVVPQACPIAHIVTDVAG